MADRLECYVGCKKCDVRIGEVRATSLPDKDYVWQNYSIPDPLPKFCKLCNSVVERI